MRKPRLVTLSLVTLSFATLTLVGCAEDASLGASAPPVASTSTVVSTSAVEATAQQKRGASPSAASCTDRIDYTGDPRSNAEINSIGERAGSCPPVEKHTPSPTSGLRNDPQVSCTNRIDYGGDPRDDAEINSIGQDTGVCPTPQR